jgi:hypothetical protein
VLRFRRTEGYDLKEAERKIGMGRERALCIADIPASTEKTAIIGPQLDELKTQNPFRSQVR